MIYNNLLELIGNTPIVKINQFDTGPCDLFIKLEYQNPGQSIKDRIALSLVETAEQAGELKPGDTIVEGTAGNTGVSLALVALTKGYKLVLVIPDKMSHEKIDHLKAMGVEIIMTRSDVNKGHPEYYQDLAQKIANDRENAFYINQFGNPANPKAHEASTGPEIWQQMEKQLDAIVIGAGTSGTITGVSHYFQKTAPHVEIILADPEGSILKEYIDTGNINPNPGKWLVEGIGEDYLPTISDLHYVNEAISVSDKNAFHTGRELLRKEGIYAGSSSGLLFHAALDYCRKQTESKRVLTFACDSGSKYLSKMYNDTWLKEHKLL